MVQNSPRRQNFLRVQALPGMPLEWRLRTVLIFMCLAVWLVCTFGLNAKFAHAWELIALSFGIFLTCPALLEVLIRLRSLAAFPVLILQVFLAAIFLNSFALASIDSFLEYALAAVVVLTGSGNGTYLCSREAAKHFLREGNAERKDVRQRVDALVRVKLVNEERSASESGSTEIKHICVVVRDFSRTGLGIYGFPDDVSKLIESLKSSRMPRLHVIYREQLYVLDIDLRWSKESPNKGECGLLISPNGMFQSFQKVLAADAGTSLGLGILSFAHQHRSTILAASLWFFSLASLILVARA